jgi:hypothetical protein
MYGGTLPAFASISIGSPGPVFVTGVPTLTISSVGGVATPANPAGSLMQPPDISLPAGTTSATVQLAATAIPLGTTATVRVTPRTGTPANVLSTPLSGTAANSTASADVTLATGLSVISAETTITVAQAGSAPILVGSIDGEKVEKIRIATAWGGASSLTYITASGREIPANLPIAQ